MRYAMTICRTINAVIATRNSGGTPALTASMIIERLRGVKRAVPLTSTHALRQAHLTYIEPRLRDPRQQESPVALPCVFRVNLDALENPAGAIP
jgi:hypothetical protein